MAALSQAALSATQKALSDKASEMVQKAAQHQQALKTAEAESNDIQRALSEKHHTAMQDLQAAHQMALEQQQSRCAL